MKSKIKLTWERKIKINKRGEIYLVSLDGVGSEQRNTRAAIIVQNDVGNARSPTTVIVPLRSVNSLEIMLLWRCVCQIDSIQSKRV